MFYVYCITNLKNNKVYIGKTLDPKNRFSDHKKVARGGKIIYGNQYSTIHKAITKYGEDNFSFKILHEYNSEISAFKGEIYWISFYKSNINKYGKEYGYNLTDGGEGISGYKHTLEMKAHISDMLSGDKHPQFGISRTQEEKDKISKSLSGSNSSMFGIAKSIETKNKLSIANRGENGSASKLNNGEVINIKLILKNNVDNLTREQIAQKFGVTREAINKIAWGKSWSHITI